MTKRTALSKSVRFEVFKRDKFTCQYCGKKAPDVVLEVDHIHPVAEGGTNEVMNLITSCADCNGGKGARLLSDDSVVERQRKQIEELEERRQQLEMMLAWRDELSKFNDSILQSIADHIGAKTGIGPNERGLQHIRKWLKKYTVEEILNASDEAMDALLEYRDDKAEKVSWEKAFLKIPGFARVHKEAVDRPYVRDLYYIQGIVRNRCGNKWYACFEALEKAHVAGATIESLMRFAKQIDDEEEFEAGLADFHKRQRAPQEQQ